MVRSRERGRMLLHESRLGRWRPLAIAALACVLGCSAYDPSLLHIASAAGGLRLDAGKLDHDADTGCTEVDNDDGCCPPGKGPAQDADCGRCGDGVVGPRETCDPPESCPTRADCKLNNACVLTEFTGSPEHCDARCEVKPMRSCRNGDGCCPSSCTTTSDSDCSKACGDGIVDRQAGETCEPTSTDARCPASCDDGDPCTQDLSTGSANTCSLACSHVRVTAPAAGDGCCPAGAHALNDSDCAPRCGNGVVEPGEACDGGPGCTPGCTALSDEQRCQATLGESACAACACSKCAAPMLHCYQSGDAMRDAHCQPVVECALQESCIGACRTDDSYGCYGQYCWCGGTLCPNTGRCRSEIAAAAGTTVPATIVTRARDPQYPLYDADQYGICLRTNCASACGI